MAKTMAEKAMKLFKTYAKEDKDSLNISELISFLVKYDLEEDKSTLLCKVLDVDGSGKFSFDCFLVIYKELDRLIKEMTPNKFQIMKEAYKYFQQYLLEGEIGINFKKFKELLIASDFKELSSLDNEAELLFRHLARSNKRFIIFTELVSYLELEFFY